MLDAVSVTKMGPASVNVSDTVSFSFNVTNNDTFNYTGYLLNDTFNPAFLNSTSAIPVPVSSFPGFILWNFNLTVNQSSIFYVNFTALQGGNTTINVQVLNATSDLQETTNATVEIFSPAGSPPASITVIKIANVSNVNVNDSVTFTVNVTNTGGVNLTNLTLVDHFDPQINYSDAIVIPTNVGTGEVNWTFNLSINETISIDMNFTAISNGVALNHADVKNATGGLLGTANSSITVNATMPGFGSMGNYTALWSHAQNATFFTGDITDFNFIGAPYVARGPGCKLAFDQYENASPGESCCSTPGGCGATLNPQYDLGAVWVDQAKGKIAWHIMGPFNIPNTTNLSVCDAINKNAAYVVEFDIDDNLSTGCDNTAGEGCYPGSDFQLWFFPDSNKTLFAYYNGSNNNTRGAPTGGAVDGIVFVSNESASLNDVSIYYNCSATPSESKADIQFGFTIIANKSIFGVATPKLNFETNSFNVSEAATNPIDQLTDNGQDKFIFMGSGSDQGACFQYDHTNQSACESNNESAACIWNSFPGTQDGLCDPDFSSFTKGAACFTYNNSGDCGNSNLSCHWEGSIQLPDGSTGLCVEDFSQNQFGGGSCDDDCFNCFTQSQCQNSEANGGNDYGGCAWYNDTFNPNGWCDVVGIQTGCANNPDDCYTATECTNAGWYWNSTWHTCLESNSSEICFNGVDDNGNGQIDCADSTCENAKACGGQIDTLTGSYAGFTPEEALEDKLASDMGPILFLKQDIQNDSLNTSLEIKGLGMSVSSLGLAVGIPMENLSQIKSCGGAVSDVKFLYLFDNDANQSTGCNVTIDTINYPGYEFFVKYGNFNTTNESGQDKMLYACYNNMWIPRDAVVVTPPTGDPGMGGPRQPLECGDSEMPEVGDPAVIMLSKADIGNPQSDMRFTGVVLNGSWNNMSNLHSFDMVKDAYYTPGTMDFEPVDCFQEPTKCGAQFAILGGGEYMPFEDCIAPGDEDADGLINCQDPDCVFAPQCTGQYNLSMDKTRPKVTLSQVETFNDFAVVKWTTNKPTKGNVSFYYNSSSCSQLNASIFDEGQPGVTLDDYKPWHAIPLDSVHLGYPLSNGTTYYYKIVSVDPANNTAISACLNFTTASSASNVTVLFNFTSPVANESDFLGNLQVAVNGVPLGLGNSTSRDPAMDKDINITFFNPNATGDKNWSLTLVGADISQTMQLDFADAFLANKTPSNDTYVGMVNGEWLNMVQKTGADYVVLKIPEEGDRLEHCSDNGENCTNVTDVDGVVLLGNDTGYTEWKLPTTLGFSSYTTGGNATYTLVFTNTSAGTQTVVLNTNATYLVTVNNTMSTSQTYNFTLELPTNVTGTINGTATLNNVTLAPNATTSFTVNVSANTTGSYTFNIIVTLMNDSSVVLNSSDDITLTLIADDTAPVISSLSEGTPTSSAETIIWSTDENATTVMRYGTTTAVTSIYNSSTLVTSHSVALTGLSASTTYYYNISSCDEAGNCNTSVAQGSFTTVAVTTASSGGGGGATTTTGNALSYTPSTVTLSKVGTYRFTIVGTEYEIRLGNLGSSDATFNFDTGTSVFMRVGDERNVDIVGSSDPDVYLNLDRVSSTSATILIGRSRSIESDNETSTTNSSGSSSSSSTTTDDAGTETATGTEDGAPAEVVETTGENNESTVVADEAKKGGRIWPWVVLLVLILLIVFVYWAVKTERIAVE